MHFANKTLLSFTLSVLASAASAATDHRHRHRARRQALHGRVRGRREPAEQDDGERAVERAGPLSHRQSAGRDLHGADHAPSATRAIRAPTCSLPPTRRRRSTSRCRRRKVRWSDLSTYQGRQLLPKTKKHDLSHKDAFFTTCFQSCHSFQKRMATADLGRERLARARHLHARRDDGGPPLQRRDDRGFRLLPHDRVRTQLAEAGIARGHAANTSRWCVRSARTR